jgi:membrane associated rhomboid family serine protease
LPILPVHSDHELNRIAAPYVTWGSILLCVVVEVWLASLPARSGLIVTYTFGFVPGTLFGDVVRQAPLDLLPSWLTLITYQFLHSGIGHLIGNMVIMFVFGGRVEDRINHLPFALLFLVSGVVAGLAHGLAFAQDATVLVGASGAIAGVLGAYLALFPRGRITLLGPLFIPLRLRAWAVIGGWFAFQMLMTQSADASHVAWWAHVGGFGTGLAVGFWYRRFST